MTFFAGTKNKTLIRFKKSKESKNYTKTYSRVGVGCYLQTDLMDVHKFEKKKKITFLKTTFLAWAFFP